MKFIIRNYVNISTMLLYQLCQRGHQVCHLYQVCLLIQIGQHYISVLQYLNSPMSTMSLYHNVAVSAMSAISTMSTMSSLSTNSTI